MPGAGEVGARGPDGVECEREVKAFDQALAVDHREVVVEQVGAVGLLAEHTAVDGLDAIVESRLAEGRIAGEARAPAEGLAVVAPGELVGVIDVAISAEFGLGAGCSVDAGEPVQRERLREAEVPTALGAVPVAGEADGLAFGDVEGARGVEVGGDGDEGPVDAAVLCEEGAGEQQRERERAEVDRHATEGAASRSAAVKAHRGNGGRP